MSTSTNAQISFGIYFEEGYEFPWGEETEWEGDMEEWWLVESGWKWDKEPLFNPRGDYNLGFSSSHPLVDEYFTSRYEWKKSHPCPVEEVNYQSGEVPAYILAIPESIITARRGYPEVLNPSYCLTATDDMRNTLIEFCQKYGLEMTTGPQWYLSSYWG